MNITFLIGNGFDINLGLKTRYTDFYPYYLEKYPDEMIAKEISKEENNYETWADLELGLGNMLKDISKNEVDDFLDSKAVLEECLTDYLKEQENTLIIKDCKKVADIIRKKMTAFFNEFNTEEKGCYLKTINSYRENINFSFITFNYTNSLDRIINEGIKDSSKISEFTDSQGYKHSINLTKPFHIHGMLENGMILGVNDKSQINNPELQKNRDLQKYFIKSNALTELGEQNLVKAKQLIDNSNYVCLFGLSIGDTDTYWWAYLMEWLRRDSKNRLVIYTIDNNNIKYSAQQKLRSRDKTRRKMIKQSRCTDSNIIDTVFGRIIIINNSKIFDFQGIFVETEATNGKSTTTEMDISDNILRVTAVNLLGDNDDMSERSRNATKVSLPDIVEGMKKHG